jgi:hypothetical protein
LKNELLEKVIWIYQLRSTMSTNVPFDIAELRSKSRDLQLPDLEAQCDVWQSIYSQLIKEVEESRQIINKKIIEKTRREHSIVFQIIAIPDQEKNRCREHVIVHCSTQERALKEIGIGSSYDDRSDVKWNYSVEACPITNLCDDDVLRMDKIPSYFPYIGSWNLKKLRIFNGMSVPEEK